MTDKKILYIDNRERSGLEKLVMKYCDKNKIKYEVLQTHLTDYTFGSVGIESKSINDYMSSLFSGHLEQQLQNLDDNYAQPILLVWGTLDQYVAQATRSGRKIPYSRAFSSYTGSLARWCNDFDIQIITFPDKSSAARFICKRFEKDGTLSSTNTYRVMRRTSTEDMRVDVLRAAGCSDAIAKRMLEAHGSVAEIAGLNAKTLMGIEGVGKVRAERIMNALNSEEAIVQERVKMSRA
tara:strand:- start:924 stop:1634 length:711 start_codon:yes stop_codon:yes gene_type:complete